MADQKNGIKAYSKEAEKREKKLIEMLVNTDFPMKKKSKTSEELILNSIRRSEEANNTNRDNNNRDNFNRDGKFKKVEYVFNDAKKPSKGSNSDKGNVDRDNADNANKTQERSGEKAAGMNTKNMLDQFLEEMDKKEKLSLNSLERSMFEKGKKFATISCPSSKYQSARSSVSRVFPPLDARLLTTFSVLTGDLSSGRNFKILGRNGERIVGDALLKIGWQNLDHPGPPGFFSSKTSRFSGIMSPASYDSAPAHLTWADSPARLRNTVFVDGAEMVNHVPNMALLSDKIKLHESLSTYERQVMGGGMRRPGLGIVGHIKMDRF